MIKIDLFLAMTLVISFSIFIVFIFWLFYNGYHAQDSDNAQWLKQCPYCTCVFFYYPPGKGGKESSQEGASFLTGKKLLRCPHCKSYIEIESLEC